MRGQARPEADQPQAETCTRSSPLDDVLKRAIARSADDNFIVVSEDLQVTGAAKNHHRARVFIQRRFMRDLLDENIKQGVSRQVNGLRMHQVSFEEDLDPDVVFRDTKNNPACVLYPINQLFVRLRRVAHVMIISSRRPKW
jgi:hypothetical protein